MIERSRVWIPAGAGGRIFVSKVNFLCSYFGILSKTTVAHKRSQSDKHLMYVALHEVTWCVVVWCTQNVRRDGCSYMWHQPCQHCDSKYTTSNRTTWRCSTKSTMVLLMLLIVLHINPASFFCQLWPEDQRRTKTAPETHPFTQHHVVVLRTDDWYLWA